MATADARGHLMRGQLLYHALLARGAEVSVLTTSDAGREFLAEFGVPAEVLSRHYGVLFDKRQKMRIWATDLRIATYFFLPWHMLRDIRRLSRRVAGVDLIVNDSFHPALLVMGGLSPWRRKVVHVYGWSLRESLEHNFMGRMMGPWAHFFRWLVRLGLSRARGRLVHDFAFPLPERTDCSLPEYQLPTPIALIDEGREKPPTRKAAVYLNPHFSDPALAEALEAGLQEAIVLSSDENPRDQGDGSAEDGVFFLGEGYAGRTGWVPYETNWIDIAARAEMLVSAPGMAALAAAQALDKPILLIVTAQPEQQKNATRAAALGLRHRVVRWNEATTTDHFKKELGEAYRELILENKSYISQRTESVDPELPLKERLNTWVNLLMAWSRTPEKLVFEKGCGDSFPPPMREQIAKEKVTKELGSEVRWVRPNTLLWKIIRIVAVFLPPIGVIAAMMLLWGGYFGPLYLALFVFMYLLTGFGITIGFHRFFTHAGFKTSPAVVWTLGILGSMAIEGPLIWWVATHRRHHRHSDKELDPHSPHAGRKSGFLGAAKGLLHAHVGWTFYKEFNQTDETRYAPDLLSDPRIVTINRLFALWVVLGLLIPTVIAGVVTWTWSGALLGFIWGGLVRVFMVHHVTWSVNSVCHFWGSHDHQTGDESRNNALMGVLGLGEGWHNNHHAFPTSARHGLEWWQIDPSWIVIYAMKMTGMVTSVKVADLHTNPKGVA